MNSNKVIYWVGGVVLLIVIVFAVVKMAKKSDQGGQAGDQKKSAAPQIQVAAVANTQVPQGLPSNLPFETNAQILQNFTAKDPATGKIQSTRAYVSSKTLDENYAIYQKYMQNNGWTVASSVNQPTIKNLDANKNGARLDVTISKDAKGQITVNVSYVS